MTVKATDVTLTGTLTDLQGNLVNGTLTFTLEGFGSTVPLIAGTQALTGIVFTVSVSSGVFTANFYSNQIITPGPLVTFYNISFVSSGTTQSFNFSQNYQFSAGTFDISQLTPLTNVIANTALPNTVTPHTFAATGNIFLTGLTAAGNFTSNSAAIIAAKADAVTQQANIASTLLYAVPATGAGSYQVSGYAVVTQAATTSSTLPFVQIVYTDADTNVSNMATLTNTNTGNTVGTFGALFSGGGAAPFIIQVKASTNINYQTSSYASSGATVMQYAVHVKLEYLGN